MTPLINLITATVITVTQPLVPQDHQLASHEMNLNDRQPVPYVNQVFKDNILLNMAYMRNTVSMQNSLNWIEVEKPFHYEFKLEPGQTFAFHEDTLPEYKGKVAKTTNAHFNYPEGFKSDGYLTGDGVCHLASLMYWVSRGAGLETKAPNNHNFANIPGISKEYGVSIYNHPGAPDSNAKQNLYITNNQDKAITFKFDYSDNKLKLAVVE